MLSSRKWILLVLLVAVAFGLFWTLRSEKTIAPPEAPLAIDNTPAVSRTGEVAASTQTSLSALDKNKITVLDEILASGNDNDGRIDSELHVLSPELRVALRGKYLGLPAERRNSRGMIVYLLGRDLSLKEDVEFMAQVVSEAPCMSMRDCKQPAPPSDDPDTMNGTDVALAYPQIVAIQSLEAYIKKNSEHRESAREALRLARRSDNSRVANWAQKALDNTQN